ncbi:MAG: hypothetical protein HY903_07495 [Deltaproteobacteria bacterium]|nr:hypothetical protein [Deltaproteobacteria bacterium]
MSPPDAFETNGRADAGRSAVVLLVVGSGALGLVAVAACARSEAGYACAARGRAVTLSTSFEAQDASVATTGAFAVVSDVTAHAGRQLVRLQGDGGALATTSPVPFSGDRARVAFWLRNGSCAGVMRLQVSTDGGVTYYASVDSTPDLTVARDPAWMYTEIEVALTAGASALFSIVVTEVSVGLSCNWLEIDDLTAIDPDGCLDGPAVPCSGGATALLFESSFGDNAPPVAMAGAFAMLDDQSACFSGASCASIAGGEGDLLVGVPVAPGCTAVAVGYFVSHPAATGTLDGAISVDHGQSFSGGDDPPLRLDVDRTAWVWTEQRFSVPSGTADVLARVRVAGLGLPSGALRLDLVTVFDVGACE